LLLVLAAIYAMARDSRWGAADRMPFGLMIGLIVCGFVLYNYVNLNIGLRLMLEQAVAYFAQWMSAGIVGAIYWPAVTP
jgi:hypothetical protein